MTRNALVKKISSTSDSLSLARGKRRMSGKRVQSVSEVRLAAKLVALRAELLRMDSQAR